LDFDFDAVTFPLSTAPSSWDTKETNMNLEVSRALRCTALALGLASCGDLADEHSAPPVLMTFQGSLTLAEDAAPPTATVRLALLWHVPVDESALCTASGDDSGLVDLAGREGGLLLDSIQQAVDITPQFPSSFRLDVREPPPARALYERMPLDAADTRKVMNAQASFVVYVDGNDNGRLDARTDAAPSRDQVLSARSPYALLRRDPRATTQPLSYYIVYSTEDVDGLRRGYNLFSDGANSSLLPLDSEIQLELWPTPGLQAETCMNECLLAQESEDCPADPTNLTPIPSDAQRGYTVELDHGADAWTWQAGPDSFGYEARECFKVSQPDPTQDYYSFISLRVEATACERRERRSCRYDARGQPPASWPCQTFLDRSLQRPQTP
jgi:hypothetical protein